MRGKACRYMHVLPPNAGWPGGVPADVLASLPNGAVPGMAAGYATCVPQALPSLMPAGFVPHAGAFRCSAAFGPSAKQHSVVCQNSLNMPTRWIETACGKLCFC